MEPTLIGAYGHWAVELLERQLPRLSFRREEFAEIEQWRPAARQRLLERMAPPALVAPEGVELVRKLRYDGLDVELLRWPLGHGPATEAVLLLEQKSGLDKAWPKLKVFVDKENHWISKKIEYLDKKDKKHKTEVRKGVKKMGGRTVTSVMAMKDHGKKHSTTIIMKAATFNKGLSDKMFTKRYLVREE